jgi:hypothetical protein
MPILVPPQRIVTPGGGDKIATLPKYLYGKFDGASPYANKGSGGTLDLGAYTTATGFATTSDGMTHGGTIDDTNMWNTENKHWFFSRFKCTLPRDCALATDIGVMGKNRYSTTFHTYFEWGSNSDAPGRNIIQLRMDTSTRINSDFTTIPSCTTVQLGDTDHPELVVCVRADFANTGWRCKVSTNPANGWEYSWSDDTFDFGAMVSSSYRFYWGRNYASGWRHNYDTYTSGGTAGGDPPGLFHNWVAYAVDHFYTDAEELQMLQDGIDAFDY